MKEEYLRTEIWLCSKDQHYNNQRGLFYNAKNKNNSRFKRPLVVRKRKYVILINKMV